MSTGLAIPTQPTSLVAVDDTCAAIEAWADQCESIPELRDATHKLAAIDEYLDLTSTEGRGRVAAAMRRLEVRIGKLLPPKEQGKRSDLSTATERLDDGLSKDQRSDFRRMAEHEDKVEEVIASSTDEAPASRAKVKDAINPHPKPRRPSLNDAAGKAGWELRKATERVERICADDRFASNKEQVAAQLRGHLTYAVEVFQDLLAGFDHQSLED